MSSAEPLTDVERVTSEGLDHVFTHDTGATAGHNVSEDNERSEDEQFEVDEANGLSVAQTAVLLGFDQQSVVKLIKERKLCAKRAFGTRNWVIDLECVQAWLQKLGFGGKKTDGKADMEPPDNHKVALPSESDDGSNRTLWYKLDLAGQQLRAASYRIGYLESQVELYKNQVTLLSDLQSEAARTRSAEAAAEDLRMQLSLAQTELARLKRPWWKMW